MSVDYFSFPSEGLQWLWVLNVHTINALLCDGAMCGRYVWALCVGTYSTSQKEDLV